MKLIVMNQKKQKEKKKAETKEYAQKQKDVNNNYFQIK